MPLSESELVRVLDAHTRTSIRLRASVVDQLERIWIARGGLTDADMAAFVTAAVPIVQAAQRQVAALTDAQLTYMISSQLEEPIDPVGVAPDVTDARGVPAAVVYARPVIAARTAKAPGVSRAAALEAGRRRLWYIATTDLQLARTHQAVATMEGHDRVVGYRRELRGAENCPLCLVASTQTYRRGDLMPIHPGCDCGVVPIVGHRDPGRIINRERYEQAKADGFLDEVAQAAPEGSGRSRSRSFGQNRRARGDAPTVRGYDDPQADAGIAVREHGEIGPVLTVRDQHFTGPDDL